MTNHHRLKLRLTERSYYGWLVWGLAASFFFLEYLARVAPSMMVPELMEAFRANAFQIGSLSAFFHIAYVGMQIPVGALVDRYQLRYLLAGMACLCGLSCIGFAYTPFFHFAEFARFVMGFSSSFAFVGAMKLVTVWFSSKHYGLLAGLTQSLGMFGAAVSEGSLGFSLQAVGWQLTMAGIGGLMLILGLLIWLWVRDHPEREKERLEVSKGNEAHIPLWQGLASVLRNPQSWINGLYVGFLYAAVEAFGELWGVPYLERVDGLSVRVAGIAVGLVFMGWTVGGPLIGFLSDRWKKRRPLMILSAVFCTVIITAILYSPYRPLWLIMSLLFLFGFSNTGVGLGYALASEINARTVAGVSIAFANMASVIIGAFAQPIMGWLLDWQCDHAVVHRAGLGQYSPESFRWAMLMLPILLLSGIVSACFIKETHAHRVEG